MSESSPAAARLSNGLIDRRVIFDRRLGERRSKTIAVPEDRRNGGDRRRLSSRRESPAGHIRNALQVIHSLAQTETVDIPLQHTVQRLYLALGEVERLERWAREIAQRLRWAEVEAQLKTRL